MEGITEGGHVLKIPINDNESVFIEHRSDSDTTAAYLDTASSSLTRI